MIRGLYSSRHAGWRGGCPGAHLEWRLWHETVKCGQYASHTGVWGRRYRNGEWHFVKPNIKVCPAMGRRTAYMRIADHYPVKGHMVYLHRVVAALFCPRADLFATEVDHVNGNKYDNRACNLEWVTPEENRRRYEKNKFKIVQNSLK